MSVRNLFIWLFGNENKEKIDIEPKILWDEEVKEEKEKVGEYLNEPNFEDVIFEEGVGEIILKAIEKIKEGDILNILFYGNAGTGKTYSARMLACETNKPLVYITGSQGKKRIIETITNLKEGSIVLVDEIHNLRESVAEIIYPAIQDNEIYLDGNRIELNAMFVGTTTEIQELPKPLRERFHEIELAELEPEKLKKYLKKRGCPDEIIDYLLNHSTNMRVLNNLLDLMKLYGGYSIKNLKKVFKLRGIKLSTGLSKWQEKYLSVLEQMPKNRASLTTISIYLGKSSPYIKENVEPELMKKKYIIITTRGRMLHPEYDSFTKEQKEKAEYQEANSPDYDIDTREEARKYLNEHKNIKEKFGNRYLELVDFIAELIEKGIDPDTIDIYSFGKDKDFWETFNDEYKDFNMEEEM